MYYMCNHGLCSVKYEIFYILTEGLAIVTGLEWKLRIYNGYGVCALRQPGVTFSFTPTPFSYAPHVMVNQITSQTVKVSSPTVSFYSQWQNFYSQWWNFYIGLHRTATVSFITN